MSSLDGAIIDTEILEHPDLLPLPRSIRLLAVEAIVWCRLHHTDGRIPAHMLSRITDDPDPKAAAAQLVEAGRWTMTAEGWLIVDYLDKQMSAERVKEKRQNSRERYDRWQAGKNKQASNAPDNAPANEPTNGAAPSRPDRTRPVPIGRGRSGGRLADASRSAAAESGVALAPRQSEDTSLKPHDSETKHFPLKPSDPDYSEREMEHLLRDIQTARNPTWRERARRFYLRKYGPLPDGVGVGA